MTQVLSETWLRDAADAVNDDDAFAKVSDGFEATVAFGVGGEDTAAVFEDGEMRVLGDAQFASWDFALRAPAATWRKMLAETPPPRHHDLVGAWLQADLTLEGDLRTALRHLQPLKRVLSVFREVGA
jgi:putative sterol carrier protein